MEDKIENGIEIREKKRGRQIDRTGWAKIPFWLLLDDRISSSALRLYGMLKIFAKASEKCAVSIPKMAIALGKDNRTIIRLVANLEECNLIKCEIRDGKKSIYWILNIEDSYCESDGSGKIKKEFIQLLRKKDMNNFADYIENDSMDVLIENSSEQSKTNVPRIDNEKLLSSLAATASKAELARQNRERNREAKKQNQIPETIKRERKSNVVRETNVRDAENRWCLDIDDAFPEAKGFARQWFLKEKGIVRRLMNIWGPDVTIQCLSHIVMNWHDYVDRFRLQGYPSLGIIAKMSESWFPEIISGKEIRPMTAKKRSLARGEYQEGKEEEEEYGNFFKE